MDYPNSETAPRITSEFFFWVFVENPSWILSVFQRFLKCLLTEIPSKVPYIYLDIAPEFSPRRPSRILSKRHEVIFRIFFSMRFCNYLFWNFSRDFYRDNLRNIFLVIPRVAGIPPGVLYENHSGITFRKKMARNSSQNFQQILPRISKSVFQGVLPDISPETFSETSSWIYLVFLSQKFDYKIVLEIPPEMYTENNSAF